MEAKGMSSSIDYFIIKLIEDIKIQRNFFKNYTTFFFKQKFEKLKSLPGVGQKTANVVLNCAFGHHTIAVDTHVFRVANRIGFAKESTPEKCEIALLKNIPKKWQNHAHHWMILHGRYICKARKPDCQNCKIEKFCEKKF
jgi:endonuclease-3